MPISVRPVARALIYALRCGGRERLFRAIFDAFAFDSIESALAGKQTDSARR